MKTIPIMIETKLQQLKQLKSISLSEEERGVLRASVARKIQIARAAPTESYWQMGIRHGLRIGLSTFLFMIFVGGSVSVIADNSLPGDALYSFKVNFNEEVRSSLMNTPEKKLSWEKTRIDRRLSEIKTLASTATLTKERQAKAQQALDIHLAKVSVGLATLSEEQPREALKITAELEENLKANKEDIKLLVAEKSMEEQENALKAVDDTLQKVSDQEIQIVSKELDNISKELTAVPENVSSLEEQTPSVQPTSPPTTPLSP